MNLTNIAKVAKDLSDHLIANKEDLFALSISSTGNSYEDTEVDFTSSVNFLMNINQIIIPDNLKPKGNILIILSHNEPLLLSVIPIFCALVMGNTVTVKPSSKSREIFMSIWSPIIHKHALRLTCIPDGVVDYEALVKVARCVYFFGSKKHASSVYQLCAKHFVEFVPEIEAADCRVLNNGEWGVARTIESIINSLEESFTHSGMMCQRVSGIFVRSNSYNDVRDELIKQLEMKNYSVLNDMSSHTEFFQDLQQSGAERILVNNESYLIFKPNSSSVLYKNAYFAKSLWIMPYDSVESLIDELNTRNYYLGLSIISDDQSFTEQLVKATNFSRYTVNRKHCELTQDTGWGGNWPSGVGGYRTWFECFSNKFTVIG